MLRHALRRFSRTKYHSSRPYVRLCSSYSSILPKTPDELLKLQLDTRNILLLIRTFKQYGHLVASIDPLQLHKNFRALHKWTHGDRAIERPYFETFDLTKLGHFKTRQDFLNSGYTEEALDKLYYVGTDLSIGPEASFFDIVRECQRLYCGSIGTEYEHLHNRDACAWIRTTLDESLSTPLSPNQQLQIFRQLVYAETFEKFLGKRFSGAKRFSIEGGESLIPGLQFMMQIASEAGIEVIQMGMAHRGRLNLLANVLHRPLRTILSQFQQYLPDDPEYPNNSDDVRYHLGTSSYIQMDSGRILEVSLSANPSHLEAVNSVVLGQARSRQFQMNDDGSRVMPLLLHGDAAMFQGSVREAFGFSSLSDYETGGTVHIIINNQIGFTTLPKEADSSMYCSDVAKINGAPVYHVNADDPEAVVKTMKMAIEYRLKFHKDVVVDLVCYRRHGHNEQDSPEITSPVMYKYINQHPTVIQLYMKQLLASGNFNEDDLMPAFSDFEAHLAREYKVSKDNPSYWDNAGDSTWRREWFGEDPRPSKPTGDANIGLTTGIDREDLEQIGSVLFRLPKNFNSHKKVEAIMNNRLRAVETGDRVDWATAEALAIGSLIKDGHDVRISGQDCERGTFNQRHAVLYDQLAEVPGHHTFIPFQQYSNILERQYEEDDSISVGRFQISNSPLSEEGAVAFEYGYSLQSPQSLTVWEAQFGDFADGAQTIIDTFIVTGEQKWDHQSALVMLLPHGYEGQGPEHSSARIERFLLQTNEDPDIFVTEEEQALQDINVHIFQPTTPAQYFHALRRQVLRSHPKPLIMFTPKYLLHHRPCNSDLDDMAHGTTYVSVMPPHPVDEEKMVEDEKIRRLIFCSGKIYYHLLHSMRARQIHDIATARIEQLAPFPFEEIATFLRQYKNARVVWVQEEPKNMGAWVYVSPRLQTVFQHLNESRRISYTGREPSASSATGQFEVHQEEMRQIIDEALKD